MTSEKKVDVNSFILRDNQKDLEKFKEQSADKGSSTENCDQFMCLGCGFTEKVRFPYASKLEMEKAVSQGFLLVFQKVVFYFFCRKCRNIFN